MKKQYKLLTSLIALIFIASCTTNPYTGKKQLSKTVKYLTFGALGGGVAGQLIGGTTASTVTGAGIGAAIGGGIGLYMDNQQAELKDKLNNSGVQIQRVGNEIHLIMTDNVTFRTDQYKIEKSFYEILDSVAIVVKKYDKTNIIVNGHTDSTGTEAWNKILSKKRAESVGNYLVKQEVSEKRIRTKGFSSSKPIASNETTSGRRKNRRVKIILIPIE